MDDEAYLALLSSLLVSCEDIKHRQRRNDQLKHLRKLFGVTIQKQEQLLEEAIKCQVFILEVVAQLPSNQNLVVCIFNDDNFKQYTINPDEIYKFDIGTHTNFKLKFALARFNGENKKTVVRSSSFLKRMMSLDRKDSECLHLNTLSPDVSEKRCLEYKGTRYMVELKITKETRRDNGEKFEFNHLLTLVQTLHEKEAMTIDLQHQYDGQLPDMSMFLMESVSFFCSIPPVVLLVVELSVFLVWDNSIRTIDQNIICDVIEQLRGIQIAEGHLLTESLIYLSQCVQAEMLEVLSRFENTSLFPPNGYVLLKQINSALKTVVDICVLSIWDNLTTSTTTSSEDLDPSSRLSTCLQEMLHKSCLQWADNDNHTSSDELKETYLKVHQMYEMLSHNYQTSNLFFHQFNIDYVHVSLTAIDQQLENLSKEYLNRSLSIVNSRSSEELEKFSKCTMRYYETIASICNFSKQHGMENLRIHSYEDWFSSITVLWTFSWRDMSRRMVQRISLIEDEEESKSELKRPLPNGIYPFLCIQKGLSDDYSTLAFEQASNILMGTMKLVHIFCENTWAFSKNLYNEAIRKEENTGQRLVKAVNGMEQSSQYIVEKWKTFLRWPPSEETISKQEQETLEKAVETVLNSTFLRVEQLIESLITRIVHQNREELCKMAKNITLDSTEYSLVFKSYTREISSLERLNSTLAAVDGLVDELRTLFLPKCFRIAVSKLFVVLEEEVEKHLKKYQAPDYFGHIYVTLKALMELLELPSNTSSLATVLHYKSFSTSELILSYFLHLTELAEQTYDDDPPQIKLQIGYQEAEGDNKLISVSIHELCNFPTLNPLCDRIDPYVKLELFPRVLFPENVFVSQKTRTLTYCQRPQWNQDFQFLIPTSLFYTCGAALCVSVWDHDRIVDQLLGRTFISIALLPNTPKEGLKTSPISSHSLLRPSVGHSHPFFAMLRERSRHDSVARQFVLREKHAMDMYVKIKRFSQRIAINKLRKSRCK